MQRTGGEHTYVPTGRPRLLPWTEEGKPALLSTDDAGGIMSRLADNYESAMLEAGEELLAEAAKVLGDPVTPTVEVRYMAVRLSESLAGVLRVAESRGQRLPAPMDEADGGTSNDG
ncbi:hypothetical protein ACFWP5_02930 [Streptomyces sp. NPDC058469]|uniref:hypothetical protein n=1 Tax=Streptomyces sp. NPDC058469 TaxID=3346514 RepID=UPI0036463530